MDIEYYDRWPRCGPALTPHSHAPWVLLANRRIRPDQPPQPSAPTPPPASRSLARTAADQPHLQRGSTHRPVVPAGFLALVRAPPSASYTSPPLVGPRLPTPARFYHSQGSLNSATPSDASASGPIAQPPPPYIANPTTRRAPHTSVWPANATGIPTASTRRPKRVQRHPASTPLLTAPPYLVGDTRRPTLRLPPPLPEKSEPIRRRTIEPLLGPLYSHRRPNHRFTHHRNLISAAAQDARTTLAAL